MRVTASGLKAIIVEDEPLLLMCLEDMLVDEGVEVIGTAVDLNAALVLAETSDMNFAVLDAHIIGGDVRPVFDVLSSRGIPVLFSTGSSRDAIREKFGDVPVLTKPFMPDDLKAAIARIIPS